MKITGENIMNFGIIVMVVSAVAFLPMLCLSWWGCIPDDVLKVNGTILLSALFITIIGLFIP